MKIFKNVALSKFKKKWLKSFFTKSNWIENKQQQLIFCNLL